MKRLFLALAFASGCTNYDALVERCIAEGRCPEGAGGGRAGTVTLVADQAQLAFSTALTDSSASLRVVLTNQGTDRSDSISVAAEGAAASEYTIAAAPCSGGLSRGQTCAIDVTFHPTGTALGARDAALVARPGSGEPLSVPLAGVATPAFDAPAMLDFGPASVASAVRKQLAFTNLTSTPKTLGTDITGPFAIEQNGCTQVVSRAPCSIDVRYDAFDAGAASGMLRLQVDSTSTSIDVALQGFGAIPGVLRMAPSPVFDGGLLHVGMTDDRPFTVTNTGSQTVNVALSVAGDRGDAFSLTNNGCSALDAGQTCNATLRFAPTDVATYESRVVANAGPAGLDTMTVGGSGQRDVTFHLNVATPSAGTATFQIGDGGVIPCAAQCMETRTITPFNAMPVTVRPVRTVWWDLLGFSGACSGDGGCVALLDGGSATVAVNVDFTSVNRVFLSGSSTGMPPVAGFAGGGRAVADQLCRDLAAGANLPGSYVAWVSVSDGGAIDRLPSWGGWQRLDGLPFAMNRAALARGDVLSRISLTQLGVELTSNVAVRTGTNPNGTPASGRCSDWTAGPTNDDTPGATDGTTGEWTQTSLYSGAYCTTPLPVYCFQTDGRGAPLARARDAGQVVFVATGGTAFDAGASADAGTNAVGWFTAVCTQRANAFGLTGGARPVLSTTDSSGTQIAQPQSPNVYWRPDGFQLSSNLFGGAPGVAALTPNVRINPDGGLEYVSTFIATGGAPNSTGTRHCGDWVNPSADLAYGPLVGRSSVVSQIWDYGAGANPSNGCNNLFANMSVYCLSDPQ